MCLFSLFPSLLCCRGWRDALCRFSVGLPDWLDLLYATSVRFHQKYPRPSMPALESTTTNRVAIVQTSDPHFLLSPLSWATYTPPSVWLIGWLTGFKASNIQLLSIFKDLELDIMQVYVVVYIKLFLRVFPPQHSILIILNCIKLVWIRRGRYMISLTVYWE